MGTHCFPLAVLKDTVEDIEKKSPNYNWCSVLSVRLSNIIYVAQALIINIPFLHIFPTL